MKITKIGKRGFVFTFNDLLKTEFEVLTNIYLINAHNTIYLCDTFLGPACMESVNSFIRKELGAKTILVFNSHSDWDHIWGNCYFESKNIIAHKSCRENIINNGLNELIKYEKLKRGDVEIVLPEMLFKDSLRFEDDGVVFFHTPGHTADSASCYDAESKILYAGDNLEYPHPYLQNEDISTYIHTLQKYQTMDIEIIVSGHGKIADRSLIEENLKYLIDLKEKNSKLQ